MGMVGVIINKTIIILHLMKGCFLVKSERCLVKSYVIYHHKTKTVLELNREITHDIFVKTSLHCIC